MLGPERLLRQNNADAFTAMLLTIPYINQMLHNIRLSFHADQQLQAQLYAPQEMFP